MMTAKIRKYLLPQIPYLFALWFFLKLGTAHRLADGADFGVKLVGMMKTIGTAFENFAPGLNASDWLAGVTGAALLRLIISVRAKKAKKFRKDVELRQEVA